MSNSAPTTSCRPIYHQEYFIFDREDLQTLTGESPVIISVRNREGNEIELSASESRTVTDIIVWSCVVVILSLLLLSVAFCCHCCLCYVNRRRSAKRKRVRMPFLLVFGCGVLTAAVVLSSFVNGGILFWLEIDLNMNLTSQADSVQNYINMTTELTNRDNDTVKRVTLDPLFRLQDIRFWITLGFLGCLLVVLAITFLSVCICTPVSKSAAPLVTMLIVEAVFTVVGSIVASTLFGTILFFSINCYDLYRLGGERWCDEMNNAPLEQSLGNFCGKNTVYKFYITAGTYGILIILLVVVQLLGGVYTAVVTHGYSERPIRHTRQHEQPRQRTLERARGTQNDRDHRQRPSRNTRRSTANPTARTEETFILRARPSQHQRYDPLNSFTPTRFREPGQDMESQNLNVSSHPVNALNLSAITYPEEAPPSYDEVIRRDSDTNATPLIATTPLQALSGVPEANEPASETDVGVTVTSAVDHEAGNDNQEDDTTAEEDLGVEAPV